MIDLYYWPTPNGHKIALLLEETQLAYRVHPVNINQGEQRTADYLSIAPNNKIPAIVDDTPLNSAVPIQIFESGAIMLYLAEKAGRFFAVDMQSRYAILQWLFWQNSGLGPMAGQNHHFAGDGVEKIPYAIDRFVRETARLYGVLERRLTEHEFVADIYSIADMAIYPWIVPHQKQSQDLQTFPNVKRWFETIAARPATVRAYALAATVRRGL